MTVLKGMCGPSLNAHLLLSHFRCAKTRGGAQTRYKYGPRALNLASYHEFGLLFSSSNKKRPRGWTGGFLLSSWEGRRKFFQKFRSDHKLISIYVSARSEMLYDVNLKKKKRKSMGSVRDIALKIDFYFCFTFFLIPTNKKYKKNVAGSCRHLQHWKRVPPTATGIWQEMV